MNQQAFIKLINPIRDKMYRLALRLLISKESAEDATQEVILKLWNRKDKLKHYANIEAFAMTVTKNYCFDELKSKKNANLKLVHSNYEDTQVSVHKSLEYNDALGWIDKIVRELPEQQQVIFQLRDVEDYDFEEIAEILDMNATAVRVNLSRARKKIRESLVKKHSYGITKN